MQETQEAGFHPWAEKILWRRKCHPIPAFLPVEFHGQKSLAGYNLWGQRSWTQLSNWAHWISAQHMGIHTSFFFSLFLLFSEEVFHNTAQRMWLSKEVFFLHSVFFYIYHIYSFQIRKYLITFYLFYVYLYSIYSSRTRKSCFLCLTWFTYTSSVQINSLKLFCYTMTIFSFIRHQYHYNYQLCFLLRYGCNRLHDALCRGYAFIDVQGNKLIAFIFLCTNLSKKISELNFRL